MKKLMRKILGIKKQEKKAQGKNIYLGRKTLDNIKIWESQKSDMIIRSNFDRELYYKYLSLKQAK